MTHSDNPNPPKALATRGSMPRRRARWGRRVAWVALVLAVVLLALAAGFFPHEPLRRLAERELSHALGGACQIGSLRLVPALLRVEAHAVCVEGPGFTLTTPRVLIDLDRRTLLGRRWVVEALEIDRPRLVIRPEPTR